MINATPRTLYSPGHTPTIHCIGDWAGSRASLDARGKSLLRRNSIPGPSRPSQVAVQTELSRFTCSYLGKKNIIFYGTQIKSVVLLQFFVFQCFPSLLPVKFRLFLPKHKFLCINWYGIVPAYFHAQTEQVGTLLPNYMASHP